jgi:hypothetical protein
MNSRMFTVANMDLVDIIPVLYWRHQQHLLDTRREISVDWSLVIVLIGNIRTTCPSTGAATRQTSKIAISICFA